MTLHSGIDTLAFVSNGVFTKTYGSSDLDNICNLFASYGMIEDAAVYAVIVAYLSALYHHPVPII